MPPVALEPGREAEKRHRRSCFMTAHSGVAGDLECHGASQRPIRRRNLVFVEGGEAREIFVIRSGRLKLERADVNANVNAKARPRVATSLLDVATAYGASLHPVPRDLTQADLGAVLGLAPETVCRVIGQLEKHRIIEVRSDAYVVLDLDRLTRIAS